MQKKNTLRNCAKCKMMVLCDLTSSTHGDHDDSTADIVTIFSNSHSHCDALCFAKNYNHLSDSP